MRTLNRSDHGWIVALVLLLALGACSDSTGPSTTSGDPGEDGLAVFDGSVDPGRSTFVLQRIEQPGPPGTAPILVELIGSNLRVGELVDTILIDVAVRNLSANVDLFPPAWIWVHDLRPREVSIANADALIDELVSRYGFDYSELLGEEGVLPPGETSKPKTWMFHDPGLAAFSFGADAHFSLSPDRSHISGVVFIDDNFNGVYDPEDAPVPGFPVALRGADLGELHGVTNDEGRYTFYLDEAGLYSIWFRGLPDTRCGETTNPLLVVLSTGPDGRPRSYDDADYGFNRGCDDSLATRGP
jgi:hypothetical protein